VSDMNRCPECEGVAGHIAGCPFYPAARASRSAPPAQGRGEIEALAAEFADAATEHVRLGSRTSEAYRLQTLAAMMSAFDRALAAQDGLRERTLEEAARTVAATEPAFAYGIPDASDTLIRAAARVRALSTPAAPTKAAGRCTECQGPVYHRPGSPGEYDHECAPAAPKKETEHHE
jgi:HAMP domain-containing protein